MSTSRKSCSRRHLLRAAGFTISLPVMHSLRDLPFVQVARAAEIDNRQHDLHRHPKRFCCIFFPNGVSLPPQGHPAHARWHWFPHEFGDDYKLSGPLEPLAQLRREFTILSGLSHPAMRSSIAHITADSFLTGADSSTVYRNSISVDQLIARAMGRETRFPSLTLSSDGGVGAPGRTQTLSFSASGRPIPSLAEPRAIFNRLFGVRRHTVEEQRRAFGRDRSIFDNLLAETTALQRHLSMGDRQRLDEYATSVRAIENRLAHADRWLDAQAPTVAASEFNLDVKAEDDAQEYIRAILDLMHIALLTDSTRSITYQITSEDAKGIGDRFPVSIGLAGHHALSHGTSDTRGYEDWARYDQFLAKQFAYFLERLRTTDDPFQDGTLLDHTIVLYGCSTSKTHLARNYPLILAGGKSMHFRHGSHRLFDENKKRMSDLHLTILQQLGLQVAQFADSADSLPELLT